MQPSTLRHVLSAAAIGGVLALATAATASATASVSATATATASASASSTATVQSVLDDAGVPGASVTVVTPDAVGETVTTDGEPASQPRRVGSVSKGVAGAVADALVQEGRISLDEPVRAYLPSLPAPYRDFTMQQLLTHTTGLPHDVTVTDVDRPGASAQSVLGSLPTNPALGKGYRYSSLNYILVQAVVEARSGTTYADAVTRVLGTDSLHADCTTPVRAGRVPFFTADVGASEVCDGSGFGYGYLSGTQAELAKWAQWNLSSAGRAFHERSKQHSVDVRDGQRYGFGWNYGTSTIGGSTQETIWHPGAVPGTYTLVKLVPEKGTAVVVSIPKYGELRAQESTDLADRAVSAALGDTDEPATKSTSSGALVVGGVSAAVLAALIILALQVRRIASGRGRRAWRIVVAAVVAALAWAGLVLGVPAATGVDVPTLATWAPDLALLVLVLVAAATVGLVLSGLQRARRTA